MWNIEDSSFYMDGECIESPSFGAANDPGTRWSLQLYPKGHGEANKGYMSIYVELKSSEANVRVRCKIFVLNAQGQPTFEEGCGIQKPRILTLENPSGGWP